MKKYIANIVTDSKVVKCESYINKCKSLDEIDNPFPTIIVGLENAKKYIKNFSILKKEYKEQNLWWTFKKTERCADYKDDMERFNKSIIDTLIGNVKYSYINVMKMSYNELKRILTYIKSDDEKYVYNDRNKFLFLYSETYKTVFGLSLTTSEYFGIRHRKIIDLLKKCPNTYWISNFNNIPLRIKRILGNKLHSYLILNSFFI